MSKLKPRFSDPHLQSQTNLLVVSNEAVAWDYFRSFNLNSDEWRISRWGVPLHGRGYHKIVAVEPSSQRLADLQFEYRKWFNDLRTRLYDPIPENLILL